MIVELGIAALPVAGCLVGLFLGRRAWPRYVSTPWVPAQLRELAARLGYDRRGFEEGEALSRRINDELIEAKIRAHNFRVEAATLVEELGHREEFIDAVLSDLETTKRKLQETERRVYNQRAELRRWEEKAKKRREQLREESEAHLLTCRNWIRYTAEDPEA